VSCQGERGRPDAPEPSKATPRLIVADEPEPNGVVKVTATTWKLGLATIGGSAVIAMGVLGAVFGNIGVAGPGQALSPVAPQATQQTVTTTTPPTSPTTNFASPAVSASTPSGFAGPGQAVTPVAPQATEQTVTTTTTPPVPETSAATPSVTATTPSGFMPVTKP
jgi:hypothetical protein